MLRCYNQTLSHVLNRTVPSTQRWRHIKALIRGKGKSSCTNSGVSAKKSETDTTRLFKTLLTSYLTSASLPMELEVLDPITFDRMQSRSAQSKEISLSSIYCRPPWRFLGSLTQPKNDVFKSSAFSKLQSRRKKNVCSHQGSRLLCNGKISPFAQSPKYGMWPNYTITQ